MKDFASKMHTEEQIGLILGGDVGEGFLGEAQLEQSPGQGRKLTSFQAFFSDYKIIHAHCKKNQTVPTSTK